MYQVLRAVYERTGEVTQSSDGTAIHWSRVCWLPRGLADSMEDAKNKHGGSPVLEWIGPTKIH